MHTNKNVHSVDFKFLFSSYTDYLASQLTSYVARGYATRCDLHDYLDNPMV